MLEREQEWLRLHAVEGPDTIWRCRKTGDVIAVSARMTEPSSNDVGAALAARPAYGMCICTGCIALLAGEKT
jgi:hypothetical protein